MVRPALSNPGAVEQNMNHTDIVPARSHIPKHRPEHPFSETATTADSLTQTRPIVTTDLT